MYRRDKCVLTEYIPLYRDILLKRNEDLRVNSQTVNEQLNNITHEHNQTLQDLQSSAQRLLVIITKSYQLDMYYRQLRS